MAQMTFFINDNPEIRITIPYGLGWHIAEAVFDKYSSEQFNIRDLIFEDMDHPAGSHIYLTEFNDYSEDGDGSDIRPLLDAYLFNQFYCYCENGMNEFIENPRSKIPPPNRIPIILSNWEELLGLMREDPRFDCPVQTSNDENES